MYVQRADGNRDWIEIDQIVFGLQIKLPARVRWELLAAYDRLVMLASHTP
jgi:hypothetical protein